MSINVNKLDQIMNTNLFKAICIIDTVVSLGSAIFMNHHMIIKVLFGVAIVGLGIIVCLLAFRYKCFVESEKRKSELESEKAKLESEKAKLESGKAELENRISNIESKNTQISKDKKLLEENIHHGLKYIRNDVTVILDKNERTYKFQFTKEYEIISDDFYKWFSAQFYANKFLDDKNKSKEYYRNNQIKWNELHVRAQISIFNSKKNKYDTAKNMEIVNITDGSNYIPFKILYTTFNDKRNLNIKKGTKVLLNYCYKVPVKLWGSYLNRSISYFGEPAKVTLKHEIDSDLTIKVSQLSESTGTPVDVSDYAIESIKDSEHDIDIIVLESKPFARYRIWWDSSKYFDGDCSTVDAEDKSMLTNI